jgi:hypothetical protein
LLVIHGYVILFISISISISLLSARYGAQYGGPNFNEAEAAQRLHLEEYFHTKTSAPLAEDAQGNRLAEELLFDRSSDPSKYKWCFKC